MKKTVAMVLLVSMLAGMVSCGSTKGTDDKNSSVLGTEQTESMTEQETEKKKQDTKEQKGTKLLSTYQVPMRDIYIDVPNYQEIMQGFTELFIVAESRYVAITTGEDITALDSKDAHEKIWDSYFVDNMSNYEGGINSITIEKDGTEKMNDLDVYYFEGTIQYGYDHFFDGYAVGYSFIIDDLPCEIIGSVIDESQPEDLKNEIREIVEEMMQSVRSEQ